MTPLKYCFLIDRGTRSESSDAVVSLGGSTPHARETRIRTGGGKSQSPVSISGPPLACLRACLPPCRALSYSVMSWHILAHSTPPHSMVFYSTLGIRSTLLVCFFRLHVVCVFRDNHPIARDSLVCPVVVRGEIAYRHSRSPSPPPLLTGRMAQGMHTRTADPVKRG